MSHNFASSDSCNTKTSMRNAIKIYLFEGIKWATFKNKFVWFFILIIRNRLLDTHTLFIVDTEWQFMHALPSVLVGYKNENRFFSPFEVCQYFEIIAVWDLHQIFFSLWAVTVFRRFYQCSHRLFCLQLWQSHLGFTEYVIALKVCKKTPGRGSFSFNTIYLE